MGEGVGSFRALPGYAALPAPSWGDQPGSSLESVFEICEGFIIYGIG